MLIKGFFSFWTRWILIGMSREIEYDLRNDLLARLLEMDPEFYSQNRTGDLMSRVTNDLNAVRMVLGPGIMYTATTIATMVMAIFFMVKLSPVLTLWVLVPVPFVAFAVRYFGQIIHRLSEEIQAALGVLSTRAQENLTGVRVIRAYAQEKPEIELFDRANRDYVDHNIKLIGSWSLFFPALAALIGVTVVILLGHGRHPGHRSQRLAGHISGVLHVLDPARLSDDRHRVRDQYFPARRRFHGAHELHFDGAAEHRGFSRSRRRSRAPEAQRKWPAARSHRAEQRRIEPDSTIRGEIEFRHLTFAYPTGSNGAPGQPVLHDINLKFPAGSTLAIVGPTGSGKSTLAALVARLWEAPRGDALIDGRSIRDYSLSNLRRATGYVPQDTFLFSETIRENIAFGVEESKEDQILEAAEIASISGEIQSFPQSFETMVGERGITLSGGQKQRTSLARAILRQPRILVLDDSLSSVDTDTEEKILRQLGAVMRQRTTILVAHRISTVKNADQIIVLREGRIIERGTHDQLLELGGYYADLYQKQLLEEELERE